MAEGGETQPGHGGSHEQERARLDQESSETAQNSDLVDQSDGVHSTASPSAGSASDAALKAELKESQERYLRLLAEFENYKKRVLKERSDSLKYQGERVFVDLLGVVDDFDLALRHATASPEQLRVGVEMIHKKFIDLLGKWEVKGESAVGLPFDPVKHQAISRIKVEGKDAGTVIDELKKVYFYKDKLLRVAEVVVASAD